MKWKDYESLSEDGQKRWMFEKLNERIQGSTHGIIYYFLITTNIVSSFTLIAVAAFLWPKDPIYAAAFYKIPLITSVVGLMACGFIFLDAFNVLYRAWREYKIKKEYRRKE